MRITLMLIIILAVAVPIVGLKFGLLDRILGVENSVQQTVEVNKDSAPDVAEEEQTKFPKEMSSYQAEDQELWEFLWQRILGAYPDGYDYSVVVFDYEDITCDGNKEYIASHVYEAAEGFYYVMRVATRLNDGTLRLGRAMFPYQKTIDQVHSLCLGSEGDARASLAFNDFGEDNDIMSSAGDMICSKGLILNDQVCLPHFLFWPRNIPDEGDVSLVMYRE